ncbi:MAG TPA: type IV secretion system protein, partial [Streptosporangiaceae bacterium]|nr:type IV secretion system protein [Streptosporangiaceae bacterium]
MLRLHRLPRKTAVALVGVAVLFNVQLGAHHHASSAAQHRPIAARTLAATAPAGGGLCSVPGIGDIGGLLGFCSIGSSGLTGDLNNLCQPGVPEPEPATSGIDALIKAPTPPGKTLATPYNQYGMSGQFWAATNLQCSDMTSLIGNDVAGMLFDFAKAMDRVTITVYQSAAGGGILSWLQGVANHLISGLGNAIYFPYVALVVIIAAIWLAWQGLIRKRGTATIEGTIWMVVACAAAIWLIGRPADFTGLGKGVSDGISATLNTAFAHLPSPGQASCLPVAKHDPQINPATFSYTSGRTVVDQNANELWTVLVCKPWLDGEFGTTSFATAGAKPTPVNTYGRQLLWAQAIAANEQSTTALVKAKQAAYSGIASSIQQQEPGIYPLFQGKQWTTRLEIAFAALLAAVVAGVLVLLISVTLILLKLGFLLLLIVGPLFLLVGTHPGFGRVVAVRWFEMLVGVLLKQAAVALALSLLLYCYALIMGTNDAVLPWALKILMITLVTAAVFIYRKPFQHLFAAVGYGAIGSTGRAEADLSRAAATARANTRTAATIGVPGFAAYRAARWARRNPAQAAGLALGAATAIGTTSVAAGLAAGSDGAAAAGGGDAHEFAGGGVPSAPGGQPDSAGAGAPAGAASRARAWGGSAG